MVPTMVYPELTITSPKEKDLFHSVIFHKRICCDLDGVVVRYDFPKIVKRFFGVDIANLVISAYDLADLLGVSNAVINLMFKEQAWGEPCFIEGARETLGEWLQKDYQVLIFSSRTKLMGVEGLRMWLNRHSVPFTTLDDGKGEYDVHIDDRPSKLQETNSKLKLLYNQSWNKSCFNIKGELRRVYDWSEVRREVS